MYNTKLPPSTPDLLETSGPVAQRRKCLIETMPHHCTVLVIGPPGVGKIGWILDIARQALERREKVVFVTVDLHPSEVRDSLLHFGVEKELVSEKHIRFVDCYSSALENDSDSSPAKGVHRIGNPSNIGEMTLAISEAVEKLGKPVRILFYTLTTLFLYNSPQSIAKFVQRLSSRVRTDYGSAAFALQQGVHEDNTMTLLSSFADGVVQMRFSDNLDHEWRVHHLKGVSTSPKWECFDVSKYGFIPSPHERRIESCFLDYEYGSGSKRKEVAKR